MYRPEKNGSNDDAITEMITYFEGLAQSYFLERKQKKK